MLTELKQISRHYLEAKNQAYRRYLIASNPFSHPLTVIIGQRGIGKTTTVVQHLLDQANGDTQEKSILYVPVDHIVMENCTLYQVAEKFSLAGGKYLAFDEIHKYNNWSKELKSINETFNDLNLITSGSSALEIYQSSHDLSRRAVIYNMHGLSLREYIELFYNIKLPHFDLKALLTSHERMAKSIVNELKNHKLKIIPIFSDYCRHGYYPFSKELTAPGLFAIILEQNINATLESDLLSIHPELTGNSIKKIKQLLGFVASHVPFTPTWTKLKEIVGVSDQRTFINYFKYLEDAELLRSVMKAGAKLNKLSKDEKLYLNNTNLLYVLAGSNPDKGTERETFFLSMLTDQHLIEVPENGDFLVDGQLTFEIGGKNKTKQQIHGIKNSFIASDDIEIGIENKIPLWLFGFLY